MSSNFARLGRAVASCVTSLSVLSLSGVLSASAFAQVDAGKARSSGVLEEVIVTARKRAESIQETPVAVTALSGDALREQGIVNTSELAKMVPSLQISDSTSTQIFIRGIGQRAGLVRQDPSVSVYLDGIFIPRADGQLMDTIDVDSVQVLRGPQGTLFGKNNTGGALVFTLTKPGEERGGYVSATLGNYNAKIVRAAMDVPVSDTFFSRFAINSNKRDGYLQDQSSSNNSARDRLSAIGQTRWLASDNVTVDTLAFVGKIRERFPSYHCKVTNEDALFINGLGILWAGDTDPENPTAYVDNCEANDRDALPDLHTNQGESQRQTRYLNTLMLGSTLEWAYSDNHQLKAIFGLRDALKKGPQTNSDDGGPMNYQHAIILGEGDQESVSLEFQFNGEWFEGALEYTAGLFYMEEFKSERFATTGPLIGADALTLATLAGGMAPVIPPIGGALTPPIVAGLLPLATVQDFEISGSTAAAFSQMTWHISDQWELTVGGRYTEEYRESELTTRSADNAAVSAIVGADLRFNTVSADMAIFTYNGPWADDPIGLANDLLSDTNGDGVIAPLGPARQEEKDTTFRQFTPMVSTSYIFPESLLEDSIIDTAMVYGTWSNGFKSGFLEPMGNDGLVVVEPEELENREIGFKLDMLDRSLRLNVALYSMIFTNMQLITVNVDSTGALAVTTENAGESMIEGGELELSWLPMPNLMISASYSNNNYKFTEFFDQDLKALAISGQSVVVDRSDEQFPVSPEQTASLGLQYTIASDWGIFTPRIDFSYRSRIYLGFDDGSWEVRHSNPEGVYSEAYTLVDLRLNWQNNDGDLSMAAYIKNATDERFNIGAVATGDSIGTFTEALGDPRFYGVEVRKVF